MPQQGGTLESSQLVISVDEGIKSYTGFIWGQGLGIELSCSLRARVLLPFPHSLNPSSCTLWTSEKFRRRRSLHEKWREGSQASDVSVVQLSVPLRVLVMDPDSTRSGHQPRTSPFPFTSPPQGPHAPSSGSFWEPMTSFSLWPQLSLTRRTSGSDSHTGFLPKAVHLEWGEHSLELKTCPPCGDNGGCLCQPALMSFKWHLERLAWVVLRVQCPSDTRFFLKMSLPWRASPSRLLLPVP